MTEDCRGIALPAEKILPLTILSAVSGFFQARILSNRLNVDFSTSV